MSIRKKTKSVRITTNEDNMLKFIARKNQESQSATMRRLLAAGLNKEHKQLKKEV